jgi:hypothetical protein
MKTQISEPGKGPSYLLPDNQVATGASLGNTALWVNLKSTGAIERVFSTELGSCLCGSIVLQYAGAGGPLVRHADHSRPTSTEPGFVPLRQEEPGEFEIHPAGQLHHFILAGSLHVTETVFVPLAAIDAERGDPPLLYLMTRMENRSRFSSSLRITAFARLRGDTPADVGAWYDESIDALVAVNESRAEGARVFGCTVPGFRYGISCDFGGAYDPTIAKALDGNVTDTGDVLGCLQVDVMLKPGEALSLAFVLGAYASREAAVHGYRMRLSPDDALRATETYLRDVLRVAEVLTPDLQLDLGAIWSKVNMRRVMAKYRNGLAFTNEPGVSSNVVGRDAAWFAYGNDHFMPEFSRSLLDRFARLQYADGKIPEFENAVTQKVEDYGLNINDDTPLFIMAVNHHYRSTGDLKWLERIFPSVLRAARYIISQLDDRNLVVCNSKDPRGNVWAIAGWRNVIPNYSINGAVTEINALCAAALRSASHLVGNLGGPAPEADELRDASDRVVAAMEKHLRNPENGLYFLNIDVDGVRHSDVTGDELFPVMCRVCDDETGYRIISRLNSPDFWTAAGLRTVSRDDPRYDPTQFAGLLGGVWPGLTWWYAFAAARYHPEFMVQALRSSFEHYAANPGPNNTVPGEFGEWFDGETLVNRGMRLSPWEPPRFLWAAIEGVCGFSVRPGKPRIRPLIPPTWHWVGLRRVPYHGTEISYFAVRQEERMHVYATTEVESSCEAHTYAEDVTDDVIVMSQSAAPIALRRDGEILIMLGNVGSQTVTAPLDVSGVVDRKGNYQLRVFNSERDGWVDGTTLSGSHISSIAVTIEMHGFRLLELKRI